MKKLGSSTAWLTLNLIALPGPGWAQAVTFTDLDGAVVEESVLYEMVTSKNGEARSYRSKIDRTISITGNTIVDTEVDTQIDSSGTRVGKPQTSSLPLEQPREVNRLGGGHKIWTFSNGTLTLLRAFIAGGYATYVSFRRTPGGLTCTVHAPRLHEIGTTELGTRRNKQAQEVHIISLKEISSSCKVTKSSSASAR